MQGVWDCDPSDRANVLVGWQNRAQAGPAHHEPYDGLDPNHQVTDGQTKS